MRSIFKGCANMNNTKTYRMKTFIAYKAIKVVIMGDWVETLCETIDN
jgi:hypothetical protein